MTLSKGTLKKRRINNNVTNILTNAHYDQFITMQESTELMNEAVNNMANSLKMSSSFKRKKMLQERGKVKNEIQNKLFTEAVFKVFYDSLLLDESVKDMYEGKLYSLCEQTLNQQMKDLNVTFKTLKNRNGLLESLITLCEEIAQDEVKQKFSKNDILNELEDEEDSEISEESEEKFNDEKEDFASRVVDDVKSRVLETIEREQQIAQDKQDLESELSTFGNLSSEVPEKSAAGEMTGGEENIDDSSDTDELAPEEDLDPTTDSSAPATKGGLEESISFKMYSPYKKLKLPKTRKIQESTLFGNILKSVSNKAVKECTLSESVNIDMDSVFSESVMILTLLETFQAIGITQYNKRELREFGKSLYADSRK